MQDNNNYYNMSCDGILLMSLPFNDPQIPPLGISLIKSYLAKFGYKVQTIDANIEISFREVLDDYFKIVKKYIPDDRIGNYFSCRLDVLQNHMMAYLNFHTLLGEGNIDCTISMDEETQEEYEKLASIILHNTFYIDIQKPDMNELNHIIEKYFILLDRYISDVLNEIKPKVFGLSVNSVTLPSSLYAFKKAKDAFHDIKTVIGGGIFSDELQLDSVNLEYFLNNTPYIDCAIIGEGERLFLQLLANGFQTSKKLYTIDDICPENSTYTFSPPDLSDYKLDFYSYTPAYVSTGCPFNCKFCSIPVQWGKFKQRQPQEVAIELVELCKKYGSQLIFYVDSLLNIIIHDLSNELLKLDIPVYWDGSLRVSDDVTMDNAILWRNAGFYRARLGIETGSQKLLDSMGKKTQIHQIKNTISILAEAGIKTTTFWVVGFPGETDDDFEKTLELIEELKDDIYETTFRPLLYYKTSRPVYGYENESIRLYPQSAKDKLLIETWILNAYPERRKVYDRLNRFNEHINRLGVPNPYSLNELEQADTRWKSLHKNAVPSIVEFQIKNKIITECRNVKKVHHLKNELNWDLEFEF